jgi:hypothetical protein
MPAEDFTLHFVASYVLALWSPFVSLLAGLGKEVFDFLTPFGTADPRDLFADALGILAACIGG